MMILTLDKRLLIYDLRFAIFNRQSEINERITLMAGSVIELNDATFDKTVHDSDVPVLVDFWAPWCGPCKMIAPIVQEIANEYKGRAKICKLNTDDARDSATEFGISAIPTLILFKNGQVQKKWVGLTSKKNLAEAIDELL
jgi:thioredoxin 1